MTFLGADTEAVRQYAERVRASSSVLRERVESLTPVVDSVEWTGTDAESFRERAHACFAEAQGLFDRVDHRAEELTTHAEEQDDTSGPDGGGAGGLGGDAVGVVKDPGDAEGTEEADEGIEEDGDSIDPENSAQGSIGDCYLLSSLQSIAQRDPEFLADHVEEVEPGVYEVTMYDEDGDPITYQVESVQEGGVREADGDQSLYSIYERAYKMHLDERGIDINGGYPEDAMETLTGQGADAYSGDDQPSIDELAEQVDRGNLVNADTGGIDDPSHDQIVGNHAYTVTEVNTEDGTVTVTNPWGPGNPDAPKNVTMTYEEYRDTFGRTTVGHTSDPGFLEGMGIGDGIGWL